MKKFHHPVDDFFREALEDHQMVPSEDARQAFLRDVIQVPRPEKTGRKGLILLSSLLALIGAGIIIWAITSDEFSSDEYRESKTSVQNPAASELKSGITISRKSNDNPPNINSIITASVIKNQQQPGLLLNQTLKQQTSYKQPEIIQPPAESQTLVASSNLMLPSVSKGSAVFQTSGNHENPADVSKETVPFLTITPMKPFRKEFVSEFPASKPDSIVLPGFKTSGTNPKPRYKQSNWIPSLGIYFSPEWMFNTLEGSKFVNNFGLEGTFHFGRFSVRTGAGLSIAKGTNELIVGYNDYLGSYNKLDSMQFTWNSPVQQFTPKFYMSTQSVWDSLMKIDYNKVVKRYTYLQIPIIMGYDFYQTEEISIGFRVGPVMSILLTSKQLSSEYAPGEKRIVSINDIAPEQISLNWQVMAGLNTSIRITKDLILEIEPSVRYYFNSVYEKSVNNTKPWSIGVRAAVVIK